jgi:tRNA pseudouridine38-40 synthase
MAQRNSPSMKIRVGLLVGYNGRRYHGLQLNSDLDTIEKAISSCLAEAGAISKANAADPSKIHIKSASRTDKGVHAVLNLVSMKIQVGLSEELTERLKELLGERDIHLYKIVRLTKRNIPSKQTESRIYEYIVPVYFLRESSYAEEIGELRKRDAAAAKLGIRRTYSDEMLADILGYRAPAGDVSLFREILQRYVGTKSFHNFTSLGNVKGTRRYIRSVALSDTYVVDDVEYVRIMLHGQSFLLHQIRKMVLFALLLCRYSRKDIDSKFALAFSREAMHIPKSPAEYLFLDRPIFSALRRNETREEIEIDEDARMEYKEKTIYPIVHDRRNLSSFLASMDAVRFHSSNMRFLSDLL